MALGTSDPTPFDCLRRRGATLSCSTRSNLAISRGLVRCHSFRATSTTNASSRKFVVSTTSLTWCTSLHTRQLASPWISPFAITTTTLREPLHSFVRCFQTASIALSFRLPLRFTATPRAFPSLRNPRSGQKAFTQKPSRLSSDFFLRVMPLVCAQ